MARITIRQRIVHQRNPYAYFTDRQDEYVRMNSLTSLGKIAVGLVHDLANMTQYTLQYADTMEHGKHAEQKEHMRHTVNGIRDMARLIDATRKRLGQEHDMKPFSPSTEIRHARALLNYTAQMQKIEIECELEPRLILLGSRAQFYQCVANLIINAIEAYEKSVILGKEKKKILIRLRSSASHLTVTVSDRAGGISKTTRRSIFKPFFTTKTNKRNLGFGLSLVKEIIEQSFSGRIFVRSTVGKGTTFVLVFPKWKKKRKRTKG